MILMARVLTPADYGLVGMLTIFIAISQTLVDSGFSQALIRKQERTETDNSTVFYFNIVVAIVLYLILAICAPLISRFYNEPQLIALTRVISLSIVIGSLAGVQRAIFTIHIDFRTQAKASLTAAVVSGAVGIATAYGGCGVWAIVWFQLTNQTVNCLMLWVLSKWRPRWLYSWRSFRELFSFGSKLAMSALLETVYNNIYLLVIGKLFKASDLGYYTRAQQFSSFPSSNITNIFQRVTFPVLCTIQNDDERLRGAYRRFLRLSAFIVFPLMVGLAVLAQPLVLILLKEQWLFAATLISILCFCMMWYPIHAINLNLLVVKGRSDLFLRVEVIKKIIGIGILCITIPFGLIPMTAGTVAISIICLAVNTHYTGKLIHVGFLKQMRDLCPSLFYSLSMGVFVWFVTLFISSPLLKLIVGCLTGMVYYLLVAIATRSSDFRELKSFIRQK